MATKAQFRKLMFEILNPAGSKDPKRLSKLERSDFEAAYGAYQILARALEKRLKADIDQVRDELGETKVRLAVSEGETAVERTRLQAVQHFFQIGAYSTALSL